MAMINRDAPGILPRSAFTKNSVSTVPGQISETRTPRPITSSRNASVNPTIANFVAQYPPIRAYPISPAIEAMLTMTPSPRSRIPGSAAWVHQTVPK